MDHFLNGYGVMPVFVIASNALPCTARRKSHYATFNQLGQEQTLEAATRKSRALHNRATMGVAAGGDTCANMLNPLTPNDLYMSRTAPLTSKRCILYIYSTNVGTEYFKHAVYSPFFFLFRMQFVS